MRPALLGLLVLVAFGAAGCSTLSVSERSAECGTTDWYQYGLTDGRLGVPAEERQDLFEKCLEAGAPVDVAAYRAGHTEGLAQYCTAETGYEAGRAGHPYRNVCLGQAELAFLQGYERGRKERPAHAVGTGIGVGIGIGSGHTGVGFGFPFFPRQRFLGPPTFGDHCFYNRPLCRAHGLDY